MGKEFNEKKDDNQANYKINLFQLLLNFIELEQENKIENVLQEKITSLETKHQEELQEILKFL
ncbi:MAG: hypothetical protein ABIB46_05155 [bacterium]